MKKATLDRRTQIANDIMFYIYTHIDTHIDLDELSLQLDTSKFHMHRIFKEAFGKNIYESIKSIRLQKASNLLLTNKFSTISQIANECGYSSHSSFIRAFKERFGMTPKAWRNDGHNDYAKQIIQESSTDLKPSIDFSTLEPVIEKRPMIESYYIRHQGYDASIKKTWQKLYTWVLNNELSDYTQIGLYHDNPAVTPLSSCQYIACIVDEKKNKKLERALPKFSIASGIYAKFDLTGNMGFTDVLHFIRWVYHEWLPQSDFETTTKPSYVIYHKNHFLSNDSFFDLSFYVSVKY